MIWIGILGLSNIITLQTLIISKMKYFIWDFIYTLLNNFLLGIGILSAPKTEPAPTQKYIFSLDPGPKQNTYWVYFWMCGSRLGLSSIWDPIGDPKYPIFVYSRYILIFKICFCYWYFFIKILLIYILDFQVKFWVFGFFSSYFESCKVFE